jgi:hypothetical protein
VIDRATQIKSRADTLLSFQHAVLVSFVPAFDMTMVSVFESSGPISSTDPFHQDHVVKKNGFMDRVLRVATNCGPSAEPRCQSPETGGFAF